MTGIVQGVGFRPFVYRLARSYNLAGFVNNDSQGVTIEIEGDLDAVDSFRDSLAADKPVLAKIDDCQIERVPATGQTSFEIQSSKSEDMASTLISPDVAVCDDCLGELFDPDDRRYRYPFINCTNCGPRYTIVQRVPYDRPYTSMKQFAMCLQCEAEYHDPANRRFHAQPNACPVCGPRLVLRDTDNEIGTPDIIKTSIELLSSGKVIAVRGLGGFHLAVDARNDDAVRELRRRKRREEKPFAMMARDMHTIETHCVVSKDERELLEHFTRPIVLLHRHANSDIAGSVAFDNHYLGFMLPYTPLHHLLLAGDLDTLVMTSGNVAEEPIAIANEEAQERLTGIADYFLLHDRDILQRCDDSIVRFAAGQRRIIRRARGFVPRPVYLPRPTTNRILAVGGELKNTIALSRKDTVFFSQHIGDLDNPAAFDSFTECINHLEQVLEVDPDVIACDLHPDYLSSKWARRQSGLPVLAVQHHHAHLASVMAENGADEPAIGIILDGTGYGTDGTIWGGEILIGDTGNYERYAYLEPVPMPGGTAAIRQPWRMALSYLKYAYGDFARERPLPLLREIKSESLDTILHMIDARLNSPMTSSCGRLFDGVAALLSVCNENRYEAQAATALEMVATPHFAEMTRNLATKHAVVSGPGPIPFDHLIRNVVEGVTGGDSSNKLAVHFHVDLAELFIASARAARDDTGVNFVALSGGVYQNVLFFEYISRRLIEEDFIVMTHREVPSNDGGIALGQIVVADETMQYHQ
ncbi:MAG: carbamoyltransferase HypF [Candidatus Zixiibacteriota bacterium]